MAAAVLIGPGVGSVASVTIHKMTVSTPQTEPIILDVEFMPPTHPSRALSCELRFGLDVRGLSQRAARMGYSVNVGPTAASPARCLYARN
jgi:hypothetical protein